MITMVAIAIAIGVAIAAICWAANKLLDYAIKKQSENYAMMLKGAKRGRNTDTKNKKSTSRR